MTYLRRRVAAVAIMGFFVVLTGGQPRPLLAQPGTPGPDSAKDCDLSAFVIDQDEQGLNVRAGPGIEFPVIGNLPNQQVDGIRVHLTGSSGNWVRIDRATQEGGDEGRRLFSGKGWVYGPKLGVEPTAGGTPVHESPVASSRILKRVPADGGGFKVLGCRGVWMKVEHQKIRGWADKSRLCANSLTTCS